MRTLLRLVLATGLITALVAAPAGAYSYIGAAGHSLRSDPVYVDPGANASISAEQADQLRDIIKGGSRPLFVAVLPTAVKSEVHNNPNLLPKAVGQTTGLSGTYIVVAGPVVRAASSRSANFSGAGRIATESYQAHHSEGMFSVLKAFVTRVEAKPPKKSHTSVWVWIGIAAAVVLLLVGGLFFIRRRRFQARKDGLKDEIDVLQEEVNTLITSDNASVSDLASRANTILNSAALKLKAADNGYELDNVAEQIDRAQELVNQSNDKQEGSDVGFFNRGRDRDQDRQATPPRSSRSSGSGYRPPRRMATNPPRGPVPVDQRPQPTTVINTTNNYGGTGLGYYPGYGGYGYFDPMGNFVADMMMLSMIDNAFDHDNVTIIEEHDDHDGGQDSTYEDDGTGGGGDWSGDDSDPSGDATDVSDDSSGDGGDVGGGGDWSGSSPDAYDPPAYEPEPTYDADPGGGDYGGGDFGG